MVRQRIIEEASELFAKSGIRRITMGDLAKHLCISKRTIYENFKNKEELLIACIDAFQDESEKFPEKIFANAGNMVEAMLAMLQIDGAQVSQGQFSLIEEIRKYFPQVYKEYILRTIDDRSRYFEQMIHRGIAEGVFRKNLKTEIIVHFFHIWSENPVLYEGYLSKFSLSEIFENIAVTFLRGICTAKGLEIIDNCKSS